MKKLNNKGMSLIELIISFSLVCVAIIYFFETLFITNKILRTTREDTNNYVDVAYAFNIIEYNIKNNITSSDDVASKGTDINNILEELASNDSEFKFKSVADPINKAKFKDVTFKDVTSDNIYQFKFILNKKEYYYFFAVNK